MKTDTYILVSRQDDGWYKMLGYYDVKSEPSKGDIKKLLKKERKRGAPDNIELKHWNRFYGTRQEMYDNR